MAKIQKGMAMTTAVIGILCILFGVSVSICAWVLSGKISSDFAVHKNNDYGPETSYASFGSYWWGGITFIVPGILGVIAGCTRNVVVMVFFLIFNLLCLISSLAVAVLSSLLVVIWSNVNEKLQDGYSCKEINGDCVCDDYTMVNASCDSMKSVQTILGAMIAMSAISSLLSFIAAYVSCCSLCNQEHDTQGIVIIQPGAGAYQPPSMVVAHTNVGPPAYYGQQPIYNQAPPNFSQPSHHTSHDKAKLVDNQVI